MTGVGCQGIMDPQGIPGAPGEPIMQNKGKLVLRMSYIVCRVLQNKANYSPY
jgi:hypothetical protein